MKWTLQQIAEWTHANILSNYEHEFAEIGTDTRDKLNGKVFIALKGESYDAHQFLDQAVQQGAAALVVHELPEQFKFLKEKVSILFVKDTLQALQDWAQAYRQTLKTQIIGITGSNGKTTTKEFTAQILSTFKKVHFNQGSFNNHWGVPLTLLQIPQDADFAVIEMGMNHAGEIERLVQIAQPNIVVCTMVGKAHIEFFGKIEAIAQAKSEIYMTSKPETIRIFNQDQELTFDMMYPVSRKFPDSRMLSFSEKNNEADVYFKVEESSFKGLKISGLIAGQPSEKEGVEISVFGAHNVVNLMAAATVAYACRMQPEKIWKALSACHTAWGRNQIIQTEVGAHLLFDGYNANPDSMNALLENMKLFKNQNSQIGVFGQMKELGALAVQAHQELGQHVAQIGFEQVYFIGENYLAFQEGLKQGGFKGEANIQAEFSTAMGEKLGHSLKKNSIVVIKGSRGAATERFVKFCKPISWSEKK